jgi:Rhodanese-related sulfurtransferase
MLTAIKKLFGKGPKTNYAQLVKEGAVIIDVRTRAEYESGHIKNSVNIPLDQLPNNLNKLKNKNKSIITCCASGMRSASAKALLTSNGYLHVYNGGGWNALQNKI